MLHYHISFKGHLNKQNLKYVIIWNCIKYHLKIYTFSMLMRHFKVIEEVKILLPHQIIVCHTSLLKLKSSCNGGFQRHKFRTKLSENWLTYVKIEMGRTDKYKHTQRA
jgi:hypothetical protein